MPLKEPPQPPDVPRRFRLHAHQWVGLPIIALLPVLALLRVFGDGIEFKEASTASVKTLVEHPTKFKFRQHKHLRVKVTNISGRLLDTVIVSIDTAYLSRFMGVTIAPEAKEAYKVELTKIQPHEKREVIVEIEAKKYGEQRGIVTIATKMDTVKTPIWSYIYW